jgi:hypothetical protein
VQLGRHAPQAQEAAKVVGAVGDARCEVLRSDRFRVLGGDVCGERADVERVAREGVDEGRFVREPDAVGEPPESTGAFRPGPVGSVGRGGHAVGDADDLEEGAGIVVSEDLLQQRPGRALLVSLPRRAHQHERLLGRVVEPGDELGGPKVHRHSSVS